MATFKSLNKSDTVDGKYSARKRIYLESDDDLAIFKRWFFDEGEFLEFKSSNEGEGGGCTKVIGLVDKDREMGILSFGIVDRDALMRAQEWDSFWELDDKKFVSAKPFGKYVKPLCRWEIENYLLNPNVVHALLSDYGSYSPDGIDKSWLIKNLIEHLMALVPVMAANVCLHQAGKGSLPLKFVNDEKNSDTIDKKCFSHLKKRGVDCEFEALKKRLLSFSNGEEDSDQFWCLSRIIDGKRLICRIELEFGLREDHRFNLAKLLRERGLISVEIKTLIENIKAAA